MAGWWIWGLCQWIGGGWGSRPEARQLPHLSNAGMGVHRTSQRRPSLKASVGVHRVHQNLPEYFAHLSKRLQRVRVCCGDWMRVLGPSPTTHNGLTAVILDPPYSDQAKRAEGLYAQDSLTIALDVRAWAIENGDNPKLRIALFGYEDEHAADMPEDWECFAWKAGPGYSNIGKNGASDNHTKERVWFSPPCVKVQPYEQLILQLF